MQLPVELQVSLNSCIGITMDDQEARAPYTTPRPRAVRARHCGAMAKLVQVDEADDVTWYSDS